MKINGSLVFDESGLSQITNLRVEKVSALPQFGTADIGRLVYNTVGQVLYLGGATAWTALATGGDAAGLAAEVDAIEASVGAILNSDGTYNAGALVGTLANSTSITDVLVKLQVLAAGEAVALATEIANREAGDVGNALAIGAERTRAETAEGVNTTAISTEKTRAEAAEVALGGRVDTEAAARIAGDAANATLVSDETAARIAAEAALDGRVSTEVSDRTSAVNGVATNLATEIANRGAADVTLQSAIDGEITRASTAEVALGARIDAHAVGLFWKNSTRVATIGNINLANAAAGYDGVTLDLGDRVLVKAQSDATQNGVYVFNGTGNALIRSIDTNTDAHGFSYAVFVEQGDTNGDTGWTETTDGGAVLGSDFVSFAQFTGTSSTVAGAGLFYAGNVVNVGNLDGSITITADAISISDSVRTEIITNADAITAETGRATTAENGLDSRISAEVQARIDANAGEVIARNAAISTEKTRAEAAELANATAVSTEKTRAEAAELANATAVSTEKTRAEAAELALQTSINGLEDVVDKMYFKYSGTSAASHTVIHNLNQKYCNVTVVDSDDEVVIPQSIHFDSANQLTVTFNSSIECVVVVMGVYQ